MRKRRIEPADIMSMADYSKERKARRSAVSALKANRRVEVGPFATFYFECYETMWMQVHEMLFIERGGAAQVPGELAAYNPLIPQGRELIATLMFEIEDPTVRANTLARLGHVEGTITLEIEGRSLKAEPIEVGEERTTDEGKTSSVHFLRFRFDDESARLFRAPGARAVLGFAHPNYGHMAVIPEPVRAALAEDLDPA
jgi:hypothetical protein